MFAFTPDPFGPPSLAGQPTYPAHLTVATVDEWDVNATAQLGTVETAEAVTVPCAARPGTGFVHLDGPCRCFVGGPAPEFAPIADLERRAG